MTIGRVKRSPLTLREHGCLAAVILTGSLAVWWPRAQAEERTETFFKALENYRQAESPHDYERCAIMFESILNDGYMNGAVLYNMGNAYMKAGQAGRAIACYRQAKKLRPRDPYLDDNLKVALSKAPSQLRNSSTAWWHHVLFWHASVSQNERQWSTAVAWSAAFLLALFNLGLGERAKGMAWIKWSIYLTLFVGLALTISMFLGHYEDVLVKRGVVLHETQARKGNGESYAPAFDRAIKEGAEFEILESRSGWVQIQISGVGEGWLPEKDVSVY